MAIKPRFSTVDKALLVATGNSLLICGDATAPVVNTSDLIKPDGTPTRDWTQAGSTAILSILASSTILYAELVWYSTVFSNVPSGSKGPVVLDLRSVQDNPITFTTSKGTYQITPQYTQTYTGASGSVDRYRAADVTTYVQAALSGNYTVSNVPISIPSTGLSNSRAGWALTVIYRNNSFLPQKVLYGSGIFTATSDTPYQATLTGFATSADSSLLQGNLMLSCANGNPLSSQDVVSIGPSFAQLSNIGNTVNSPGTAPNNPSNNFFAGMINVADPLNASNGLINITGTNGTHNHNAFIPTQVVGARNKWDLTNVDISNTLVTNQTLLAGQITSSDTTDGLQLVALGAQVLAQAPNIVATLISYDIDGDGQYNVEVNEPLIYSIQIKNDGESDADNVTISATIDTATSFVAGSVIINGVATPTADIKTGINLGTLAAHSIINVFFTVKVNTLPTGELIHQTVNYSYHFVSGIDNITNSGVTNTMQVMVQDAELSVTNTASITQLSVNDTVTYTINIKNTGTEINRNLFFQDKIDTCCSFLAGTVTIDDVTYTDYDPVVGFSLPDLAIGASTQILFNVKLNTLPISEKVENHNTVSFGYIFNQYGYLRTKTVSSNTTTLTVLFTEVIGERCCNNNYPKVGDTLTYTLALTNMGTKAAANVLVQEPLVPGASFITGSVKINTVAAPTLNPFTSFTLQNTIDPQATTTVQYQVLVNSINPANVIENIANVPFKYQITPGGAVINAEIDSNTVDTVANYVCMNITKNVDKAYATVGDTLYYTIQISNGGNISATNTTFLDTLQTELSFVAGSVTINGVPYSS